MKAAHVYREILSASKQRQVLLEATKWLCECLPLYGREKNSHLTKNKCVLGKSPFVGPASMMGKGSGE